MNYEALRDKLCTLTDIPAAGRVLDAGCGCGADLQLMGRRLGPDARLVGVETSEAALETARVAAAGDSRFSFINTDLSQPWPFDDEAFDGVFSNNVLECIPNKQAFLAETARVLCPGGQANCAHWDWDTQVFDGSDKGRGRRVLAAYSDWQQDWMTDADGWMGRRLWKTFGASGLFAGQIETLTLTETEYAPGAYGYAQAQSFGALVRRGFVTAEDYAEFMNDLAALAADDSYFYSVTLFVYVGHKL